MSKAAIPHKRVVGKATLYCGDCDDIFESFGSSITDIDAIVTDPPYGINRQISGHKVVDRLGAVTGDDAPFDPTPYMVGYRNIFWGANHFSSRLPDASRWLLWLKHDPSLFGLRSTSPFELAWTDLEGAARAFRWIWDGSIKQGQGSNKEHQHPTEKPVELMEWCLSLLPDECQLICDPFMGSGTTGVACAKFGFDFIGIEIEEQYFNIACQRIEEAQRQGNLFSETEIGS